MLGNGPGQAPSRTASVRGRQLVEDASSQTRTPTEPRCRGCTNGAQVPPQGGLPRSGEVQQELRAGQRHRAGSRLRIPRHPRPGGGLSRAETTANREQGNIPYAILTPFHKLGFIYLLKFNSFLRDGGEGRGGWSSRCCFNPPCGSAGIFYLWFHSPQINLLSSPS